MNRRRDKAVAVLFCALCTAGIFTLFSQHGSAGRAPEHVRSLDLGSRESSVLREIVPAAVRTSSPQDDSGSPPRLPGEDAPPKAPLRLTLR